MVRGMVVAVRSVWSTLILLLGFLYVAAMVTTSMYKEDPLYDSVLRAAMTLFLAGTVFDEILSVRRPLRMERRTLVGRYRKYAALV